MALVMIWRFFVVSLRRGFAPGLRRYFRSDPLVVDDTGLRQLPANSAEHLFEVVMRLDSDGNGRDWQWNCKTDPSPIEWMRPIRRIVIDG